MYALQLLMLEKELGQIFFFVKQLLSIEFKYVDRDYIVQNIRC